MNPVVHFEMPAEDRKRMSDFYSKVFGWQTQMMGSEMSEYVVVTTTEIDEKTGKVLISIDEKYYRPSEVDLLLGNSTKAKHKLNWSAEVKFKDLIILMMKEEFEERGLQSKDYLI